MDIKKKDKRKPRNVKLAYLVSIFAICVFLPVPNDVFSSDIFPEWTKNIKNTVFEVSNFGTKCGPAENEVCISCHDLLEDAPDPNLRLLMEPTHGTGIYRLNASEYLSIKMHSYSKYVKPKCMACHFNPNFTTRELKGFKYAKMGDKMCFTCHQDKAPKEFTRRNSFIAEADIPETNPIMEGLKRKYFAQRASVRAYKKRMKLD